MPARWSDTFLQLTQKTLVGRDDSSQSTNITYLNKIGSKTLTIDLIAEGRFFKVIACNERNNQKSGIKKNLSNVHECEIEIYWINYEATWIWMISISSLQYMKED